MLPAAVRLAKFLKILAPKMTGPFLFLKTAGNNIVLDLLHTSVTRTEARQD